MYKIPSFTVSDFLTTTAPYEFIKNTAKDPFEEAQLFQRVKCIARELGVACFGSMYRAYCTAVSEAKGA